MKRIWMLLLVVLMLCLSACGNNAPTEDKQDHSDQGNKPAFTFPTQSTRPTQPTQQTEPTEPEDGTRPSNSLLRKDLQDSLTARVEKSFGDTMTQTVSDFSVVLSQTEEKLYTASITVTAQSVYADFTWPVDVTYTKYDQGWVMTECTWGEYTYEQVRYPSEEEVQVMLRELNLGDTQEEEFQYLDGQIHYVYYSNANWSQYATGSGASVAKWRYDDYDDQWEYWATESRETSAKITKALEGTWKLYQENGTIIIKNVTETGFDVDISATHYGVSEQHFAFKEAMIDQKDGGKLTITFTNDSFSFEDNRYRDYNLHGTAEIQIILPKNTTKIHGEYCDFALDFVIINHSGLGYDVYSSFVIKQESKVHISEYFVQVQSNGGLLLKNIDILVYDGNTLVDVGRTTADGTYTFQLSTSKEYNVRLNDVPAGFEVRDSYNFDGNKCVISLISSLITDREITSSTKFELGDIMYDFSFNDIEGQPHTLSETLKEKKMVMLKFWYSDCPWCDNEFFPINNVYGDFVEDIAIFAIDDHPDEALDDVKSGIESMELKFPVGLIKNGLGISSFGSDGWPTTVIIDRYGMIAMVHAGAITSEYIWKQLFSYFTAEDYQQILVEDYEDIVPKREVTEKFPGNDVIAGAINQGNITVKYFHDGGVGWPFIVTTFNGETCIKASNSQIDSSHAILYANVELKAGQAVGFDYIISSEQDADIAYVVVNGEDVYQMSGHSQGMQWKTCYPWVALEDGTYQLVIIYLKDGTGNIGDDTIYIDNLRVVDAKDIDVDTYIPRQAAVENKNGEFTYVDIFYNEADGYYHVGSVDGPLLLANLLGYTQFCYHDSIYNMAFNGEIIKDGHDYYEDLAPFVSESPNTFPAGYCAVTRELAEILKVVAEIKGYEGTENEWLKICEYYEAYGPSGKQMEDPIKIRAMAIVP